ncbi:TonB-dependent receptor domain-containing protein [Neotamlana laminarinivorans]|uniref:TonB-dependent receptor n=1 Tax=Neotamlana laminarinivorans TaxID=2883124 RepID=A0A9X1I0R2_9FLAO|nr:TonB-dependent receptor [Tamlana laminarinivorans]MCB4799321.1 TonB-dependent receptor [Tamlana laminarinivorans]
MIDQKRRLPIGLLQLKMWLIIFFAIFNTANSQNTLSKIQGEVQDENNMPIADATVVLKGTTYGVTTNVNGLYELNAPTGKYILKVSYLGYQQKEIVINLTANTLTLNVLLKESSENLNEVVVNGKNIEAVIVETRTATKSNMSLMNTPAAIVAVNRGILDQQGITNLQDAIRNVSGVTQAGNNYNIGDNLIIRGLDANYTLDGMYSGAGLGNSYNPTRSLTNVESIEVLKGPATGLYGMGSAGGVINFVEKKPLFQEHGLAEIKLGQWNHYRAMVDYTAPLSNKFAFRIVSASEAQDGYRDVSSDRFETYGALTFKSPSNKHNITLSGAVIQDAIDIDAIGDPVRLYTPGILSDYSWTSLVNDTQTDPDTGEYLGIQLTDEQRQILANSLNTLDGLEPYDIGDHSLITDIADPNKGKEYRVKLRYDINPIKNLTITNQLLYRTYESNFTRQTGALNYFYYQQSGVIHNGVRSPLIIDDVIYPLAARRQEYRHQETKEKAFQYFGDFKYDWNLGKVKGEHLLSVNYENRSLDYKYWSIWDADDSRAVTPVPYILDISDASTVASINGSFWNYDPVLRSDYKKGIEAYGVSFQEVLYLFDEKLTARLGVAFSNIAQDYENVYSDLPVYDFDDSGYTYNLGLTFRPIDQLSIFGNYAKGRTAYSITGSINEVDESNRDDSEALSVDLGIRFKTQDNSLLASLVAFNTARTNIGYSNPDYDEVDNADVPQYFYDREDRTKGIELDVNYYLSKKLSFNVNGTLQDPQTLTSGEVTTEQTKGVPKKYARFWTEYKHFFINSKNPLLINLGVRYEDERTIDGYSLTGAHINSYTVFDAGIGYNINNTWNLRLNIDNLLNEDYYSKAMFAGALPGETRNFELNVQYRF